MTIPNDAVERAARALYELEARHSDDYLPWAEIHEDEKQMYREDAAEIATAAFPGLADGSAVVVPVEPTVEMFSAWYRYKNGHRFHDEPPPRDTSDCGAYQAMLAARPSPGKEE